MKAENTDQAPKFNLLAPEAIKPQVRGENITAVILNGGAVYEIEPGSFHLYQSAAKPPAFGPYVTFRPTLLPGKTVEVFPATIAGWVF